MKLPAIVQVSELQLGDVVRLSGPGPFMDAIVKRITPSDGKSTAIVTLERPYMSCADFDYGSEPSRIVYIGHEDVTLYYGTSFTVELMQRHPPRSYT